MWLIPFLLILSITSYSQEAARFETTVYLRDAIGNRDTIVIGHDENANSIYNPELGEWDITNAWNPIWEVRAAHFLDWNSQTDNLILSKKIIGSNEGGLHPQYECLWINEPIILFIQAAHLPVTIFWNKADFYDSYCRNHSMITPHMLPQVNENWHEFSVPGLDYTCMADMDSFVISDFIFDNFQFYHIDTLDGIGIDTIGAILFTPSYQYAVESPCTSLVSSFSPGLNGPILTHPNPTDRFIMIQTAGICEWYLSTYQGAFVENGQGNVVDMKDLPDGTYILHVKGREGIYSAHRIVKISNL